MYDTEFPSKVDAWLVIFMGGILCLLIGVGLQLRRTSVTGSLICFGATIFIAILLIATAVPCVYTLMADHLLIRSGLLTYRIPYRQISRIELSSDLRSAPALSLQRVKIMFGTSSQLVSPRDRERFMQQLQERVSAATG